MFKSLSYFQRFQAGSKLWLIFFEPQRLLFKQINWRTGFLLGGLRDKSPLFNRPLLLDTHRTFPNQALICLPLNREEWPINSFKLWNQMNRPSFRLFIPLGFKKTQLEGGWLASSSLSLADPTSSGQLSCWEERFR